MMMTPEGYTLLLPHLTLSRLGSELQESGPAVTRLIARLAENARHVGCLRQRSTGRSFPVFVAEADGEVYRIITRPVGSIHKAILAVRPESETEIPDFETRLTGFGKFEEHKALGTSAQRYDLRKVPGLYVIFRNWKPIYVGESGDLQKRLRDHLWCISHLGIPRGEFTVRVSRMPESSPAVRKNLEKAVIAKYPKVENIRREIEEYLRDDEWD